MLGSLLGTHSTPSDCTDTKGQAAVSHPRRKVLPQDNFFFFFPRREDRSKFHPNFSSLQLQTPASTGKPLSLEVSVPMDLARKHGYG